MRSIIMMIILLVPVVDAQPVGVGMSQVGSIVSARHPIGYGMAQLGTLSSPRGVHRYPIPQEFNTLQLRRSPSSKTIRPQASVGADGKERVVGELCSETDLEESSSKLEDIDDIRPYEIAAVLRSDGNWRYAKLFKRGTYGEMMFVVGEDQGKKFARDQYDQIKALKQTVREPEVNEFKWDNTANFAQTSVNIVSITSGALMCAFAGSVFTFLVFHFRRSTSTASQLPLLAA